MGVKNLKILRVNFAKEHFPFYDNRAITEWIR